MARKAQPIKLSSDELRSLTTLLRRGTTSARTHTRARVLDRLHRGQHPHRIAETLSLSSATAFNIKRRYQQEGWEAALFDKATDSLRAMRRHQLGLRCRPWPRRRYCPVPCKTSMISACPGENSSGK